jgi:hypothetical protein
MHTRTKAAALLAGIFLATVGVAGARAQDEGTPIAWDAWGGGTWAGGIRAEATADLLTLHYTVGETADDWPNATLRFAQPVDLSSPARLCFDLRVTADVERLPGRFVSLLLETTGGARWQQDTLPSPATTGEWVAEEVSLVQRPAGFLASIGAFQLFVWNRDYQDAGLPAGSEVTIELRNARLVGTRPERAPSVFGRPLLSRLLGQADGLTAWSEPADTKVLPELLPPKGEAGPVEISAAGNEYADFQVALRAEGAMGPLSVEVSPARPVGGGAALDSEPEVRLEGLVTTEQPSGYLIRAGRCPDPLLPEAEARLEPRETRALFVDLYVPPGTPAGDYEGSLSVRVAGGPVIEAVYRLHVYGFDLPATPALRTAFQLSVDQGWSHMMDYYPGADLDTVRAFWESMARHRIAPMHLGPKGPPNPATPDALAEFDPYVNLAKELGFNSFGPFFWGPPTDTEEDRAWVRQMVDHYAELGVLDCLYVYMCQYDEARPDRYAALRAYAESLKETDPRLPRFITVAPHPDLYGAIDLWCPTTSAYRMDVARERRAQGEKVWWYTCVTLTPGLLLDAPGTEHRALLWLTFTQEADGLLFWCIDYWPQNPWETPRMGEGTAGNGDGYLYYPRREGDPADRVYETVRLEVLRDGIEDYDYLAILKARMAAPGASAEGMAAGEAAMEAARRIATTATEYSLDASDYAYVRGLVAEAIEALPEAEGSEAGDGGAG